MKIGSMQAQEYRLSVTSREVVRLFLEHLQFDFVRVFHYLQGRFAV